MSNASHAFTERIAARFETFDRTIEARLDLVFSKLITGLKYAFIAVMVLYLAVCILSLSHKIVSFTLDQGALDFRSIKMILTDGLFVLIVIAITRTFLIRSAFDYALTLLEIGFVVIIRKLILLDTVPEETGLMLVLSLTSTLFFLLIVYIHNLRRRWNREDGTGG
ncbi:hypothetical protein WCX72_09175 [Sulfurimonas sp. HSL1-6]|uniref:hypothetical protein n=1 Tax=Thiomicrolovo immobilis TaxID=3131935 RepID=UPI0031FA1DDC